MSRSDIPVRKGEEFNIYSSSPKINRREEEKRRMGLDLVLPLPNQTTLPQPLLLLLSGLPHKIPLRKENHHEGPWDLRVGGQYVAGVQNPGCATSAAPCPPQCRSQAPPSSRVPHFPTNASQLNSQHLWLLPTSARSPQLFSQIEANRSPDLQTGKWKPRTKQLGRCHPRRPGHYRAKTRDLSSGEGFLKHRGCPTGSGDPGLPPLIRAQRGSRAGRGGRQAGCQRAWPARRCPLPPGAGTAGPFIVAAGGAGRAPDALVPPPGALEPGSAPPSRGNGGPGPATRGSREPPPALREVATAAARRPCHGQTPGPGAASPAAPARPVGGRPSSAKRQRAAARDRRARPAGPHSIPPSSPRPASAAFRPHPHPSGPDSSPATSSGCFPKLNPFLRQLCAAPPRRQLFSPNFGARWTDRRPCREGERQGGVATSRPPAAAGPPTARAAGSTPLGVPCLRPCTALSRHPRPESDPDPDGARPRRRAAGGPGEGPPRRRVTRGAERPAPAPRRPGPRAAAAGPGQVSYLQPETREGEREGRSRRLRRRRRGAGREEPAEPPPRNRPRAAVDAATLKPPAPSAVRPGRSLAACARVESWHFLPRSWRTAPSAGIAASCLPHPGQPFIEPPLPIGPHPATLSVAASQDADGRAAAAAIGQRGGSPPRPMGEGRSCREVKGAGPGRGGAERRGARLCAGRGGAGTPRPPRVGSAAISAHSGPAALPAVSD
ncbi:hypothetical protein H8959_007041 [Pygathrix nigripes]